MSPNGDGSRERPTVDAARAGDESALSQLYSLYFPRVYRYSLTLTGNQYDAEHLAEEVFMRLLEAIESFQWRDGAFSVWLFRIAQNVPSQWRTRWWSWSLLPDGNEVVENGHLLNNIIFAARCLPDEHRHMVSLRFAAGLSVAEAGRVMAQPEGKVKVVQQRAIATLNDVLSLAPGAPATTKAQTYDRRMRGRLKLALLILVSVAAFEAFWAIAFLAK